MIFFLFLTDCYNSLSNSKNPRIHESTAGKDAIYCSQYPTNFSRYILGKNKDIIHFHLKLHGDRFSFWMLFHSVKIRLVF